MSDNTGRNNKRSILHNLQSSQRVSALKEFNKLTIIATDNRRDSKMQLLPEIQSHRERIEGRDMISLLDDTPRIKITPHLMLPLLDQSSSRTDIGDKKYRVAHFDSSIDFDDGGSQTGKSERKIIKQLLGLILENSIRDQIKNKHEIIEKQSSRKLNPIKKFNLSVEGTKCLLKRN